MKELNISQKKFTSKNPLVKFANQRYFDSISSLVKSTKAKRLLDCGCGEGITLYHIAQNIKNIDLIAFDFNGDYLKLARRNVPSAKITSASIYQIPFKDNYCSLLLCTEVLEHLRHPNKALAEIQRVTSEYAIISVPWEPYFRLANLARLAYIMSYGNTPGHINNWTLSGFNKLLSRYFRVEKVVHSFPWMIFLVRKKTKKQLE